MVSPSAPSHKSFGKPLQLEELVLLAAGRASGAIVADSSLDTFFPRSPLRPVNDSIATKA